MTSLSIPTSILTGFLGSGKTTLLTHLLRHPTLERTAVLVNEFGEVGIDDLLLRQVTPNVLLLESGCICCTVGDDLTRGLVELLAQRDAGDIPPFERAIIETTGLADPAPVLHHFMVKPLLGRFRMAGVVATVDALNGAMQLDEHAVSVKQVAIADRLLVTKIDVTSRDTVVALVARLREINPTAPLYETVNGAVEPERILDAGLWDPRTRTVDIEGWLTGLATSDAESNSARRRQVLTGLRAPHSDRINTFCVIRETPVPVQRFIDAIESLVAQHGSNLLRIKGIVNIEGAATPLVVHGVQGIFHPPVHLPSWPSDDHRSRIVFITRDLPREIVEAGLTGV